MATNTSRYNRRRLAAVAAGKWQPFAEVEPVRAHLWALAASGLGHGSVARVAGTAKSTAYRIRAGRVTKVQRHVAEAILAIPVHDEVAVERAVAGKGAVAHPADQRAAVEVLAATGLRPYTIAQRIGTTRTRAKHLYAEVTG